MLFYFILFYWTQSLIPAGKLLCDWVVPSALRDTTRHKDEGLGRRDAEGTVHGRDRDPPYLPIHLPSGSLQTLSLWPISEVSLCKHGWIHCWPLVSNSAFLPTPHVKGGAKNSLPSSVWSTLAISLHPEAAWETWPLVPSLEHRKDASLCTFFSVEAICDKKGKRTNRQPASC